MPRLAADDVIHYWVQNQVAHVVLNRPDKLNGITLEMLTGLTAAARRARADTSLRGVVIYGAGSDFSTGLDFGSVMRTPGRVARTFLPRLRGSNGFQDPAWMWRRVGVPVVAVIRGRCYGAALQIALGADFRIAATDAELSVLESKWGLIPDMSASMSLAQLTSIDTAKRLTMTGEMVAASHALQLGIVSEVADDPLATAESLIATITQRSPDAVASAKYLFDRTWQRGTRASFITEQWLQLRLLIGANATIARKAAMARTPPQFRPRSH